MKSFEKFNLDSDICQSSIQLSTFKKCLKNCQNKSNSSHLSELSNRGYITSYPKYLKTQDTPFILLNVPQMPEKQIQFNLVESVREFQFFLSQYVLNQAQIFSRANNYDILYSLSQTSGRTVSKTHILPNRTQCGGERVQNTWIILPKLNTRSMNKLNYTAL